MYIREYVRKTYVMNNFVLYFIAVCKRHKDLVNGILQEHLELEKGYCLRPKNKHISSITYGGENMPDEESDSSYEPEICDTTLPFSKQYYNKKLYQKIVEKNKEYLKDAYTTMAKTLGLTHYLSEKQFSKQRARNQRYKVCNAIKFMELISSYMAPNEEKTLLKSVCIKIFGEELPLEHPEKLRSLMEELAARWLESSDKFESRAILSVVAPHMSHSEILRYIPDLSFHQYKAARRMARDGPPITNDAKYRVRFSREKIDMFIRFITE